MQTSISFKKKSLLCAFILLIHNASYSFRLPFHKINTKTAVMSIGITALIIFFPTLRYYYNSYRLQHQLEYFGNKKSVAACLDLYEQWWKGNKNLPILFFIGNQAENTFKCFSSYITNCKMQEYNFDAFDFSKDDDFRKIAWESGKILFLIDNNKINDGTGYEFISCQKKFFYNDKLLDLKISVCTFNNPSLST